MPKFLPPDKFGKGNCFQYIFSKSAFIFIIHCQFVSSKFGKQKRVVSIAKMQFSHSGESGKIFFPQAGGGAPCPLQ